MNPLANMPAICYNDMVMLKWMLTIFIQNRKNNATFKIKKTDGRMNWDLMEELLEQEVTNYKEGNRESIQQLIQDYLPEISLDVFINMIQLNKPAIMAGIRSIDSHRANPLERIALDFFSRFQNTRNVCTAFPDWWLD